MIRQYIISMLLQLIAHFSFAILGILLQVPIVILMGPNHDELQDLIFLDSVGKEVLSCMHFEFVHEDTSKLASFLLTEFWIMQDCANLLIKNLLFLFSKSLGSLRE